MAGRPRGNEPHYKTNYYPDHVERIREILPGDPLYRRYLDNGGEVVYPAQYDPRTDYPRRDLEEWYPTQQRPRRQQQRRQSPRRRPPSPPQMYRGRNPPRYEPERYPREPSPNFTRREYESAVKRNLHVWAKWRADVNEGLIDDIFTGRSKDLAPLEDSIQAKSVFDNERIITDPVSLMKYSVGENQVTELPSEDFLQFGIPRVNVHQTGQY